jgi:hypothetical protein
MPPSAQSSPAFSVADATAPSPHHANAPARPPENSSVVSAPSTPSKPEALKKPRFGQTMLVGYLLLIFGTAVIFNLPRYHMKAGFLEDSLVLVSILCLVGGAGLVLWAIVRKMLREL